MVVVTTVLSSLIPIDLPLHVFHKYGLFEHLLILFPSLSVEKNVTLCLNQKLSYTLFKMLAMDQTLAFYYFRIKPCHT